ncbi:MAG: adenylate cyclase [Acidobacteria bacterium]|nr:MAG: adenylate cyclase [Acidobacteriota bacterium]
MSANNNSEVEIKFVVHDKDALVRSLQSAGFREQTASTFEANTLYDLPSGNLRRAGEILRLRVYGDSWKLTHKSRGTAARHKTRVEHETAVANGEEMHAILTALGYLPAFRYEKYRSEWTDGTGEVVIDRTPIGDFAEIEGTPEWIDHTAKVLHVDPKDYITSSYAELFFRWKSRTGSDAHNMTFGETGTAHP